MHSNLDKTYKLLIEIYRPADVWLLREFFFLIFLPFVRFLPVSSKLQLFSLPMCCVCLVVVNRDLLSRWQWQVSS